MNLEALYDDRDLEILRLVAGGMTRQESLSEEIGIHQSNVSRRLMKMSRHGIVRRRQHEGYTLQMEWRQVIMTLRRLIAEEYASAAKKLDDLEASIVE